MSVGLVAAVVIGTPAIAIAAARAAGDTATVSTAATAQRAAASTLHYSRTIGAPGEALMYPAGTAVDATGNVYVADAGNDAVEKYQAGTTTLLWKVGVRGVPIGGGTDSFSDPSAVATDGTDVFVADTGHSAVQVLNAADGSFVRLVTTFGGSKTFADPVGIHVGTNPTGGEVILVADGITGAVDVFDTSFNLVLAIPPTVRRHGSRDAVTDSLGDVFVADYSLGEIHEYAPTGTLLQTWGGSSAPACQQVPRPTSLAYDAATGQIYVASSGVDVIKVFTTSGSCVNVGSSSTNVIGTKSGTQTGSGLWRLSGVTVGGANDLIYAADQAGLKVVAYTQAGAVATTQPELGNRQPPAAGALNDDAGIALDPVDHYLFTTNTANGRVDRFGLPNGATPADFGSATRRQVDSGLNSPQGVAFDRAAGTVWVADTANNRLEEFSTAGTSMLTYPSASGAAAFKSPMGLTFDPSGTMYVADTMHDRVAAYSVSGTAVKPLWTTGSLGSGTGQFDEPYGVVYDGTQATARLLVVDTLNNRIVSLDPGTGSWNGVLPVSAGPAAGSLQAPEGIAVDGSGTIWVADTGNNRVEAFTTAGSYAQQVVGGLGSNNASFDEPRGIAADTQGRIFVADSENNRVQVFTTVAAVAPLRPFAPVFMGRNWNFTKAQAVALAQDFDLIVAQAYVFKSYLAAMKAANPQVQILAYVNGTYDMSTGGTAYPSSWYAHDASGKRIQSTSFGLYLMDPSNPSWPPTVQQLCQGMLAVSNYDGCFVDSLGVAAFFPGYDTGVPIDPATGAVWAESDWMAATSTIAGGVQAIKRTMPVVANGVSDGAQYFSTTASSSVLLTPTKIGMAQVFMRPQNGTPTSFRSVARWQQDVDMLVDAEANGESVLATTQLFVPASSVQQAQWHKYSLASFLLGAGGLSYFSFLAANSNAAITTYNPWDHLDIGSPLGHYTQNGNLFERQFTNGLVVVNPGSSAARINLGASYVNLNGATVTAETLPPETGEIFLIP